MYNKNYCREYINERKKFLNLASICRQLGLKQTHLSQFLKSDNYDMFMNVEKLNVLVEFIRELG